MKAKVLYLICFALAMAAVMVSVTITARLALESRQATAGEGDLFASVPEQPAEETLQRLTRIGSLLETLARPRVSQGEGLSLEAFGYRKAAQAPGPAKGQGVKEERERKHLVSFAFCGEERCFCVVDGVFYPQGAVLPGGGRIVEILPHGVSIEEASVKKWFSVGTGGKTG